MDPVAAQATGLSRRHEADWLSGSVRGAFGCPFLPGSEAHPLPPGFTPTSHRIIWANVDKFSDLVFAALQGAV